MTTALRASRPRRRRLLRDERAALGHRRLAIIDRAGGHQPMANEDGTCWIVFNGEIYNHRDLRARARSARPSLPHRRPTPSRSSTPTRNTGPTASNELEGMFAFAIYDDRRRELLAGARSARQEAALLRRARRRAALRQRDQGARAAVPRGTATRSLRRSKAICRSATSSRPRTIYRHVDKLEPGHWLRLRERPIETQDVLGRHRVRHRSTGRRPSRSRSSTRRCATRGARAARKRSAARRVPLAAASTRAWSCRTWRKRSAIAVITTSVGFGDGAHNELEAARADRAAFQQPPLRRDDRAAARRRARSRSSTGFDEPFADASAIPTYYVSRHGAAACHRRAERRRRRRSFGGYDFRYVPHALEARARRWCRRAAGTGGRGWLGARWPRSAAAADARCAPARCSKTSARDPGRGVLRGPVLPEAG